MAVQHLERSTYDPSVTVSIGCMVPSDERMRLAWQCPTQPEGRGPPKGLSQHGAWYTGVGRSRYRVQAEIRFGLDILICVRGLGAG